MRGNVKNYNFLLIFALFSVLIIFVNKFDRKYVLKSFEMAKNVLSNKKEKVVIGTVACGVMRVEETLTLVKSALIFSSDEDRIKFIIFSEKSFFVMLEESLKVFQSFHKFEFELKEINFPEKQKEWKNLFKPCASQRLFFPSLLPDVDSLLYVDSDTIFLSPPAETFNLFNKFNSTQVAGMANEHEIKNSWYPKSSKIPFYGEFGLNSGVMLMNLTRMRNINWVDKLTPIYDKYKKLIV
jgi:UDP-xylose:glucoside alpha-1,3-xylosyltransferase